MFQGGYFQSHAPSMILMTTLTFAAYRPFFKYPEWIWMRTRSLAKNHGSRCSWHLSTTSMVDRDIRSNHMVKHLTIWFVHATKLPATNHQIPPKSNFENSGYMLIIIIILNQILNYHHTTFLSIAPPLALFWLTTLTTLQRFGWPGAGGATVWVAKDKGNGFAGKCLEAHGFGAIGKHTIYPGLFMPSLTSNTNQVKLLTTQSEGCPDTHLNTYKFKYIIYISCIYKYNHMHIYKYMIIHVYTWTKTTKVRNWVLWKYERETKIHLEVSLPSKLQ